MRKILLIVLLLVISVTSVCFAKFERPTNERWITIAEDENLGYWIDKETIKYSRNNKSYSDCHRHRTVNCWVLTHDSTNKEHPSAKAYYQLDLDCRTIKTNHLIVYDANNVQVNSLDFSFLPPKPVVPESLGEYLVIWFDEIWEENYNK